MIDVNEFINNLTQNKILDEDKKKLIREKVNDKLLDIIQYLMSKETCDQDLLIELCGEFIKLNYIYCILKNPQLKRSIIDSGILKSNEAQKFKSSIEGKIFQNIEHLVQLRIVEEDTIGTLWASFVDAAFVNLRKVVINSEAVELVPKSFAQKNQVVLFSKFADTYTVAMVHPDNKLLLEEISRMIKAPVNAVFTFPKGIEQTIELEYDFSDGSESGEKMSVLADKGYKITEDMLRKAVDGDSHGIVELVDKLFRMAMADRASDIHIEPDKEKVRIRFRVDGSLQERMSLDSKLMDPLISRLKLMAKMDIVEKRRPQDGRIILENSNRKMEFRFSSVPGIYGEKIVLRLLGQQNFLEVPSLEELNFSKSVMSLIKEVIHTPNGIFFVTGPTGSGKTTTLFSSLKYLNNEETNIMTVEDPVEYTLPGINQIPVNPAVDLTFAKALRAFLRQDPDVILIGEIRDVETAKIATEAALTGHLVLATMHTNNSIQAITRLVEIGVEPFLVAPSIIGILAQRLVRKICVSCKEPYNPPEHVLEHLFYNYEDKDNVTFYRGRGCERCHFSGYLGRVAVHEIVTIDETVRMMVSHGDPVINIQRHIEQTGFETMRYDGIKKVLCGLTTIEEVEKTCPNQV